jgi:hypothetical protein
MRIIEAITNGFPAQVTTTFPHQYLNGLIVRLYIPEGFGMQQANQLSGAITVTSATTFLVDIDTTNFDSFIIPTIVEGVSYTCPQVVPTGEVSSTLQNATQNVLPFSAT